MVKKLITTIIVVGILVGLSFPTIVTAQSYLAVDFERTSESPVGVEFRVTVTNSGSAMGDIPLEVFLEGLSFPIMDLDNIEMWEVENTPYQVPIYGTETESYIVTDNVTGESLTKYLDVPVIIGYDTEYEEDRASFKSWYFKGLTPKMTAIFNQPSWDDDEFGFGDGVRVFDIRINTGLQVRADGGWGSQGIMKWDIGGTTYFDLTGSSWWNSSWTHRVKLTFNNASQGQLDNFPVLVYLDTGNFRFAEAQSAGADIRFVDDDDTAELKYEIEKWTDNTEAWIWVKVPQINAASAADFIYMYYGNSGASDNQDAANVWDADFMGVYHLNNETGAMVDSTGVNDGTVTGATRGIVGEIDGAFDYDGSGDYAPADAIVDNVSANNAGTVELWVNFDAGAVGATANIFTISKGDTSNYFQIGIIQGGVGNRLHFTLWDTGYIGYKVTSASFHEAWHYIALVCNGTTTELYVDGVEVALGTDTDTGQWLNDVAGLTAARIGGMLYNSAETSFAGSLDEVRVSDANRSTDYIDAQVLSMGLSFITFVEEFPFVTTNAVSGVTETTATLNGNVTAINDTAITDRGFVWGTVSVPAYPGDTAPGATAYTSNWTENGTFGTGAFTHGLTGLTTAPTYYYRACAQNDTNFWAYGDEVSFRTWRAVLWFEPVTLISGTTLPDRSADGNDGTITWGSNPAGLTVTISGFISGSQPAPSIVTGEESAPDIAPAITQPDNYLTGRDMSGNPLYPLVSTLADLSDFNEAWIWVVGATIIVFLGMVAALGAFRNLLIAGIAGFALIALFYQWGIYPFWILIVYAFIAVGIIVMEKVQSV